MIGDIIVCIFSAASFLGTVAGCYETWKKIRKDIKEGKREEVFKDMLLFSIFFSFAVIALGVLIYITSPVVPWFQGECENITADIPGKEGHECARLAYIYDMKCEVPEEFGALALDTRHATNQYCLWLQFEKDAGKLVIRKQSPIDWLQREVGW